MLPSTWNGVDYSKYFKLIDNVMSESKDERITKTEMKLLCSLASSEKDRKLIKVAASSGLSASQSKSRLGIEDVNAERHEVFTAVKELQEIKEAVEELAMAKLANEDSDSDSDTDSNSYTSSVSSLEDRDETVKTTNIPSGEQLLTILKDNKYNCVSFAGECQWKFKDMDEGPCNKMIDDFIQSISVKLLHLSEDEKTEFEAVNRSLCRFTTQKNFAGIMIMNTARTRKVTTQKTG